MEISALLFSKSFDFNALRRENGAQSRNRTSDTAIFSRMLYQLSYLGAGEVETLPEPCS